VCAASCGPGNLHLINGLFDANRSGVPVLAIAAHIPAVEIGGGYFQETHPQELFRECSVYCELVSVADQLPRVLEIAMRTALHQGGVAVVVIPGEIFLAGAPPGGKPAAVRGASPVIRPDAPSLAAAAAVLNAASRVTILAGGTAPTSTTPTSPGSPGPPGSTVRGGEGPRAGRQAAGGVRARRPGAGGRANGPAGAQRRVTGAAFLAGAAFAASDQPKTPSGAASNSAVSRATSPTWWVTEFDTMTRPSAFSRRHGLSAPASHGAKVPSRSAASRSVAATPRNRPSLAIGTDTVTR
jgi:hypothetical protein